VVELIGLTKRYGRVGAVNGVSLKVEEGEFFGLLGPSGCGKTTTLRMVAGFERPDEGEVWIEGIHQTPFPPEQRPVGMVFQNYALFPNMTVFANVAFPLRLKKLPERAVRQRVGELLEMIHLSGLERRYPKELSGGQQQRVALARALARQPKVLLLDEPLSALDAKIREELRSELKRLQKETGLTALYVTHDQEEVLALADRMAVMREGRVEQLGTPRQIYTNPATPFVARFVGSGVLVPGEAREGWFYRNCRWPVRVSGSGRGYLLLRPGALSLDPEGFMAGEVLLATYLGSWVRLEVRTEDLTLQVDVLPELAPEPGSAIRLRLPPEAPFIEERS
jgi:ABC-type Fe3+/spermidine/putrescine transport system ATPase subunit